MSLILGVIRLTSKVTGSSPQSPRITAISVPWPLPVFAREPYNNTRTAITEDICPLTNKFSPNRCAARQGPSVCELDGPTPTLNISNTEIASCGKETFWPKLADYRLKLVLAYQGDAILAFAIRSKKQPLKIQKGNIKYQHRICGNYYRAVAVFDIGRSIPQ